MESLNNLATSLPSSSYANAEKELTNNFRAAALSLTTLFRSSKTASKRAYNAGYAAACHDLLNMIQQGVSTDADPSREVTIGRIMDYIEARIEAIRAREEEEEEEDEKERVAKGGSAPVPGPSNVKPVPKPSAPTASSNTVHKDQQPVAPPTPDTPSMMETQRTYALASPTPSVIPLRPASTSSIQPLYRATVSKSRLSVNPKDISPTIPPMSFTFQPPAVTEVSIDSDLGTLSFPSVAASTPLKRRREVCSADVPASASPDSAAGGSIGTSASRRRTRSYQYRTDNHAEAMDVEDEGPQRKRIARR